MLNRSSDASYLRSGSSSSSSYTFVIGCDEAGRGPLAGPVVAAAVLITDISFEIAGICDSKVTKEEERDALYKEIVSPKYADKILWAAQVIDHKEIDEINILEASLKAMRQAAESVLKQAASRKIKPEQCVGLIDGNKIPANFPCEANYVIKGDSKVYSIAMASIIAKVTRDEIMYELDKQYPIYNLGKHKGYPTLEHRQLLWSHGPSKIHRLSYRPVMEAYEKHGGYTDGGAKSEERISASGGVNNSAANISGGKRGGRGRDESPAATSATASASATSTSTSTKSTSRSKKSTIKSGETKSKTTTPSKSKAAESSRKTVVSKAKAKAKAPAKNVAESKIIVVKKKVTAKAAKPKAAVMASTSLTEIPLGVFVGDFDASAAIKDFVKGIKVEMFFNNEKPAPAKKKRVVKVAKVAKVAKVSGEKEGDEGKKLFATAKGGRRAAASSTKKTAAKLEAVKKTTAIVSKVKSKKK